MFQRLLPMTAALMLAGCVIGSTAPQGGGGQDPSAKIQMKEHTRTGWVHKGCVTFQDPEAIVSKGPVTRVEVCHGEFIYGIRLTYGRNSQGLLHAGAPSNELPGWTSWQVPQGEVIVRIEGGISKHYIGWLEFFTDKGTASPRFGNRSGNSFIVDETNSGGLRTIRGQVNKRRHRSLNRAITSMTFSFGPPCYITDIKYDLAALEAAQLEAAPEALARQEIPNRTSVEQTVSYEGSKTITAKRTLTFQQSLGIKIGREIEVGYPGVASGKASFEFTASAEFGQSYENTTTQEVKWSVPVRVPPGKKILATSTIKRFTATVPFTYKIVWYWGTRDNVVKEVTLPGVYEGVHVEDLKHDFREEPLD